jgi:predicted Zn-dependent peptidase
LKIIKNNLRPGTELYKEFRLFNALIKTRVPRENLAYRILEDAKIASRNFDSKKLRHEKSMLIKEINRGLNDPSFYAQRIHEYRNYATIQTLLNDWRKQDNPNLARVVKYENEAINWLLSEDLNSGVTSQPRDDIDALTLKIMNEKFNQKYGKRLNKEQREIVKSYVFSSQNKDALSLKEYDFLKENTLCELRGFIDICDNEVLNEKIDKVIEKVNKLELKRLDDITISRLLTISKLKEELLENQSG